MNFFYGKNGSLHSAEEKSEIINKASEIEQPEKVEESVCEKKAEALETSNRPQPIGGMNHDHTLAMFLTGRVGSRVLVDVAGSVIEGVLRNVGADYFVLMSDNTVVVPTAFVRSISMR